MIKLVNTRTTTMQNLNEGKLKKSGSWVAMLYWIYYYQRLRNSLMEEHHTRKTLE